MTITEVEDLQYVGVFRPATEPSLGWGVIGTGWIADRFVAAHSILWSISVSNLGTPSSVHPIMR